MNWSYSIYFITFPLIGGFLGWFTNYLAVKMLFHPKKPITFLKVRLGKIATQGITVQGIFPKRQGQIAQKIGKVVSTELLSFQDLTKNIISDDSLDAIYEQIDNGLEYLIEVKLIEKYKLLSLITNKKLRRDLREQTMEEVRLRIPELINYQIEKMEEKIDVEAIISSKFSQLSSDRLEQVMKEILSKEFKFIELLGGVIGVLVGLVQVIIVIATG